MTAGEIDEGAIASWLEAHGRELVRFEPLSGDVSPRRYARVGLTGGGSAIVAVYPAGDADACRRFERTTALLVAAAIPVPEILETDCANGRMLIEDAGRDTLYDLREQPLDDRLPWFERAADLAARIATDLDVAAIAALNPPLDGPLLRRELQQTLETFLIPRELLGPPDTAREMERAFDDLCAELGSATPTPCHRDFMARNLVPTAPGELSILDHQDLRLGPPAYDLASLLNDSFFPPAEIESLLLARALSGSGDRLAYHRAAAQRGLKAVGTFAAFAARGFERHLPLIPPTLSRALVHLAEAPETAAAARALTARWSQAR